MVLVRQFWCQNFISIKQTPSTGLRISNILFIFISWRQTEFSRADVITRRARTGKPFHQDPAGTYNSKNLMLFGVKMELERK